MFTQLKAVLERLRRGISDDAEGAYTRRDAAGDGSSAEIYASGEANAYGNSAERVRDAEKKADG